MFRFVALMLEDEDGVGDWVVGVRSCDLFVSNGYYSILLDVHCMGLSRRRWFHYSIFTDYLYAGFIS